MRVLVTGASGFIGREVAADLARRANVDVVAASRKPDPSHGRVKPVAVDLLAPGAAAALVAAERPTHVVHLAWNARPGEFWTSPDNLDWVAASLSLQRAFQDVGGKRWVAAGTCAEYDWSSGGVLDEDSPLRPHTLYGTAKDALRRLSMAAAAQANLSAAWGRVFWLYGPHEPARRLVSDTALSLVQGRIAECGEGLQERDFMHVQDVAGAFVAALFSDHVGPFNVGSGTATSVRDVATMLARAAGRPDLLKLGARPTSATEPARLVASTTVLEQRIGFRPARRLDEGLSSTVDWWRSQAGT